MTLVWGDDGFTGIDVVSFLDNPNIPDWSKVATRKWRGGHRADPIDTIGLHTFKANPAHDRYSAFPGLARFNPERHNPRALEVIRGHKNAREKRAYHFYIDHDGTRYQCADPAKWWTYHGAKNNRSVGIGICQGSRATKKGAPDNLVTIDAVESAAELIEFLWRRFLAFGSTQVQAALEPGLGPFFCGFKPKRPQDRRTPSQTIPVNTVLELWRRYGRLVLGHGHSGRKVHDPGEHVWAHLGERSGWIKVWP